MEVNEGHPTRRVFPQQSTGGGLGARSPTHLYQDRTASTGAVANAAGHMHGNEHGFSGKHGLGNEYNLGHEHSQDEFVVIRRGDVLGYGADSANRAVSTTEYGNERGLGSSKHGLGREHNLVDERNLGHVVGLGTGTLLEYADSAKWALAGISINEGQNEHRHRQRDAGFVEAAKLPKEFETQIHVVQKYPQMKLVEETYYVQEIREEEKFIKVPKTRVVHEDREHIETTFEVTQKPTTIRKTVHKVIEAEEEIEVMIPVIEKKTTTRTEKVPRVIREEVYERMMVPTVVEVPKTRTIEVPTGKYIEEPAGNFDINPQLYNTMKRYGDDLLKQGPGNFDINSHLYNTLKKYGGDLLKEENKTRGSPSASSSSLSPSDDENKATGNKDYEVKAGEDKSGLKAETTEKEGGTLAGAKNGDDVTQASKDLEKENNATTAKEAGTPAGGQDGDNVTQANKDPEKENNATTEKSSRSAGRRGIW